MMEEKSEKKTHRYKHMPGNDSSGLIWILGVIGASVYYIQQAQSFGEGAFGVLKALVWPAVVVYELLQFLL